MSVIAKLVVIPHITKNQTIGTWLTLNPWLVISVLKSRNQAMVVLN